MSRAPTDEEGKQVVAQLVHEVSTQILSAFGLGALAGAAGAIWNAAGYHVTEAPFTWIGMTVKATEGSDAGDINNYKPSAKQVQVATDAYNKALKNGKSDTDARKDSSDAMQRQARSEGVITSGGSDDAGPLATRTSDYTPPPSSSDTTWASDDPGIDLSQG